MPTFGQSYIPFTCVIIYQNINMTTRNGEIRMNVWFLAMFAAR